MFHQENIEDDTDERVQPSLSLTQENGVDDEEMPAPPPPPPPAEGPSIPEPVERYRKEDTRLKEILELQVSPPEFEKFLRGYQKALETELECKTKKVLEQETVRNSAQAKDEINRSELQHSIPEKIIEFKGIINLLPEVPKITDEKRESLREMFNKILTSYQEHEKRCQEAEGFLTQQLEAENKILKELTTEKDKIYFKIKEVERAIAAAEKAGRFSGVAKEDEANADTSKKRKMALPKDLSDHEAELRSDLYVATKSTKKQATIYTPEEILALQCAIFEEGDWLEGDCKNTLQHKLWKAIIERKDSIKGLDKTPRANIKEILGYDIIERHKEREAHKKQEEVKPQRQALKAKRTMPPRDEIEAREQEGTEASQSQEIVQTRKKIRPPTIDFENTEDESQHQDVQNQEIVPSRKRPLSPKQIALMTELGERHEMLKKEMLAKQILLEQEKESRLRAEEEIARIKREKEAQQLALKEREAQLKTQQETILRKEQKVHEELLRVQALTQAAPVTKALSPVKPYAQRKPGR